MDSRGITPETARAELARRELARRGVSLNQSNTNPIIDILRDLAGGAVKGLGSGGQFIASTLTGGYAPKVDFNQIESSISSPNQSTVGQIAKGIGEYAPYAVMGGAGLAPELAEGGIGAKALGLAANPGQLASGGLYGAATTQPGEKNLNDLLPTGPAGGAIESAALNALTHGAFQAFNAARPSQLFKGNLSPEELQKNLEVTKGTTTNLGDVINSPYLKTLYENVLSKLPLSGANDTMQKTANQIKEKGSNILNDLGKNFNYDNQRQALQDALKKASQDARQEKTQSFNKLNNIADEIGLKINRDNFQKNAQDTLDEIEQSPELKREFPQDLYSDLKSYSSNNEGNSLKLTNIFKGKLGDKANDAYTNGKMYEFGILKNLQNSLGNDIQEGIASSSNPDLKELYDKTQKDYAEKFAPFEDPDIIKFTRQGGDSDLLLSHFLRTGPNDRSNILSKLISKLPPKTKDLPAYNYLSKSIENGDFNPLKFSALYNNLGENQKQILFSDNNLRNKIDNYSDLVGKNSEAFKLMFNPKTGNRAIDSAIQIAQALSGYGVAGVPGSIAGMILPGLAAKPIVKGMTSPSLRESLVNAMINNKPWNKNIIPALQTGVQGINNR